jgi:hypothetical protein
MRHLSFDASGNVDDVGIFTTDAEYFVKITEGPDGALYYAALFGNRVGKFDLA